MKNFIKMFSIGTSLVLFSFLSISNAGFHWDHFREKHLDPLPHKAGEAAKEAATDVTQETKKATSKVEKAVKEAVTDVKQEAKKAASEIEKARKNIADQWNGFREDKIDPIGDAIALSYYALKDGRDVFPDGFGSMHSRKLDDSDTYTVLNQSIFDHLINKMTEKSIPLDKDNPASNNYFSLSKATIKIDPARNIIIFQGSDGMLGLEAFSSKLRAGVRVNGFTLEIFVDTRVDNGKPFADIFPRITYLDLDDTPPLVERAIAHGIHREVFNKGPLASIDLADAAQLKIPYMNRRDEDFDLSLDDAAIYFEGGEAIIQMRFKRTK